MKSLKISTEKFIYIYLSIILIGQWYYHCSISEFTPEINVVIAKLFLAMKIILVIFFVWSLLINRFNYSKLFLSLICFILFVAQYYVIKDWAMFEIIFIPIFLREYVDYKKVFKIYFNITITVIIFLFILNAMGIIPSNNFVRFNGRVRYALGFNNPNNLGLALFSAVVARFLSEKISRKGVWIVFAVFVFIVFVPNSNSYALGTFLVFLYLIIERLKSKKLLKSRKKYQSRALLIILGTILLIWIAYYGVVNTSLGSLIKDVSGTFYTRFTLGQVALNKYGFSLFGQSIEQIGFEAIRSGSAVINDYFTIDCLYFLLPIKYGLISSLVLLIIYFYAIYLSANKKNTRLMFVLVIFLLLAVSGGILEFLVYLLIAAYENKTSNGINSKLEIKNDNK